MRGRVAGNTRYPGEDTELIASVFEGGTPPQCDVGLQMVRPATVRCSSRGALRRSRTGSGARCVGPHEVAMRRSPTTRSIRRVRKTLVREFAECGRAVKHEDVEIAIPRELRILQAQRALGEDASTARDTSAKDWKGHRSRATFRPRARDHEGRNFRSRRRAPAGIAEGG